MTGSHGWPAGLESLEEQVVALVKDVDEPADLVSSLDLDIDATGDKYADWHASTPLGPMIRAFLYREVRNLSLSELQRDLKNNPDTAEAFGFDNLPARTTFGRAWRDRLGQSLRQWITEGADRIREIGYENGVSFGPGALSPEDKSDVSRRTEDRFIGEKAEQVTEEMQRLVYPAFSFGRAENAHYEDEVFLELQSHLGLTHSAAESGHHLFEQDTGRDEGAPDADTHLLNIKRLSREQISEMIETGIDRMVSQAKQHLDLNRPTDVAIDMTYLPYYGDRDAMDMVMGAPPSKSYDWCYKFATLTVVGQNVKFTLAMTPVWKGRGLMDTVLELIRKARKHVTIGTVYADAEFSAVDVLRVLDDYGCAYVIRSPRTLRTEDEVEKMQGDFRVATDFSFHGSIGSSGIERYAVNLVIKTSNVNPDKLVRFVTNLDVSNESEEERRKAKGLINRYSRRWGIENSYKTIKEFLAWTTSREFVVRLFYFGFAVLLYNMWLLVDLLVQLSLDIEHRYKPRVTAKRFLNLARKQLAEPG